MDDVVVYYDATGNILIEFAGAALELSREEAEDLFVSIGHVLQDLDVQGSTEENGEM